MASHIQRHRAERAEESARRDADAAATPRYGPLLAPAGALWVFKSVDRLGLYAHALAVEDWTMWIDVVGEA